MIRIRKGVVRDIISRNEKKTIVEVFYDGACHNAINYNTLSGDIMVNDIVYINTTANYLKLGTGGYDFVIINETRGGSRDAQFQGHIMKLKYTPFQVKCSCPSEEENNNHDKIKSFKDLENLLVIIGELHSMLPPVACTFKYLNREAKIAYIMTDGGSLPIDISFNVQNLKSKGIINSTITSSNSFGGDMEAVNIYDALIIAKSVLNCDLAVITMGPGITGTGTRYGFTGIEQGYIIDAVNTLNGIPIFIPRVSFRDSRERHYGISHHTLTVLGEITKTKAHVVMPLLQDKKMVHMISQICINDIHRKHMLNYINFHRIYEALEYYGEIGATTMGRSTYDDEDFFTACGCAAYYGSLLLNAGVSRLNLQ